eukprot:CAMPEP_0184740570 /NCGR_PEP_ID=MMETSP0315-20130426/3558_1 /TAXON_ID=101924 /ORGANISM="Rhodosorus marinus, Strain UTEX LB 2760" /LENGTH=97 /DNA_ID=CAMNT_0027210283 /DNA_START=142 /DNA_END=431 /DNA_ORIENTATION=+
MVTIGFVGGGVFGPGNRTDRKRRVCPVLKESGPGKGLESLEAGVKIDEIVSSFKSMVELRDRSYMMKMYQNCFVESGAVDTLIEKGFVNSREDAVSV